jgi:antitoxin VapB
MQGNLEEAAVATRLKDPEANRLAREVAALTGETLIEAVRKALAERLERERRRRSPRREGLAHQLKALGRECAVLPDLDDRTADEIIGYDEFGAPR